jgi:hypothetical protein
MTPQATEKAPTKATLALLEPAEQLIYQDLVNGTFGQAIRLEQERVSFASLEQALSTAFETAITSGGQVVMPVRV